MDYSDLCVDDIELAGDNENTDPMWKILVKDVDLECQTSKDTADKYNVMFESKITAGVIEQLPLFRGNLEHTFPHAPMTWNERQRNAWIDVASWRTG